MKGNFLFQAIYSNIPIMAAVEWCHCFSTIPAQGRVKVKNRYIMNKPLRLIETKIMHELDIEREKWTSQIRCLVDNKWSTVWWIPKSLKNYVTESKPQSRKTGNNSGNIPVGKFFKKWSLQWLWPAVKYEVTTTEKKNKKPVLPLLSVSWRPVSVIKKLSGNSGGQHKQVSIFLPNAVRVMKRAIKTNFWWQKPNWRSLGKHGIDKRTT